MEEAALRVSLTAPPSDPADDSLPVKVVVTNASVTPLLLNSRLLVNHRVSRGELYFSIEDADGQSYQLQGFGKPRALGEADFVVVPSGQSIEAAITLGDRYGLKRPGTYRVSVTYRNDQEWVKGDLTAWRGEAHSDTVTVGWN